MKATLVRKDSETHVLMAKTELGKQAQEILGYNTLAIEQQVERDEYILLQNCVEAQVRPFETGSVERYKEEKKTPAALFFSRLFYACIVMGIATIAAVASTVIFSVPNHAAVAGELVALLFVATVWVSSQVTSAPLLWVSYDLHGYNNAIPHGVIDLAIRLKSVNPGITFKVHELQEKKVTLDPLLSAHLGKAMLYVAVWDELDFDAKYD